MVVSAAFALALATGPAGGDAALQEKVVGIFEDECTGCHSEGGDPTEPDGLDLEVPPSSLVNKMAVGLKEPLIKPGDPGGSYLLTKITAKGKIVGEQMPSEDGLPEDQVKIISDWIASLPEGEGGAAAPPDDGGDGGDGGSDTDAGDGSDESDGTSDKPKKKGVKPFHGTSQVVLPTTTTLGRNTLQYRIDHRFGRIGTERGFAGLDAGVVMSMGLAYGIFDGWDVGLRRTNSRKGWNLYTKYVVLRQEDEWPVSLGGYVSMDGFRDFNVENTIAGNFMAMISRLWLDRWSTMLTFGLHLPTNRNPRPEVDFQDGDGLVLVEDSRGTMTVGFASTVWFGKRKRWGLDLEYLQPIPDGGKPNVFYYRGGDADPDGTPIGSWAVGGSYFSGKHFFQVFFTNNREIHMNLAAPGGQTTNPFDTPGSQNSFINELNFFLGFNLGRRFTLGKNVKKWKKQREAKKAKPETEAPEAEPEPSEDAKAAEGTKAAGGSTKKADAKKADAKKADAKKADAKKADAKKADDGKASVPPPPPPKEKK